MVLINIFTGIGCRFGTFGAIFEYFVERSITTHSTLCATMAVGIPVGVTLDIKLTRARQTYSFPIHLSDEVGKRQLIK